MSLKAEVLEGLAELLVQLESMDKELSGPAVDDALLDAANVILPEALRLVPVDTGRLRDSLYAANSRTAPSGFRKTKANPGTAKVAASAYHAHLVERGTRHSRKQPFLRPALDNKEADALRVFEATVRAKLGL
jgi:HK97 gp10 family phage protein